MPKRRWARMLKMSFLLFLSFGTYFVGQAETSSNLRDQLLAKIIKTRLEMMHFSNKVFDKNLSESAFKLYIDAIDPGKQFLQTDDIKKLEKYRQIMHELLNNGDFTIVEESKKLLLKRYEEVEKIIEEDLKKPMDLKVVENLETDPEKRSFAKNSQEQRELWHKLIKYAYFNHLLNLEDEQKALAENKNPNAKNKTLKNSKKKKEKKVATKKMTQAEMEKEALNKVRKRYHTILLRLKKESHDIEVQKYINAFAGSFDPHTYYFPPDEEDDFNIKMKGKLEGIGAVLQEEGEYIKVVRIVPGSASWKQKELGPEDLIIKVAQGIEEPVDVGNMRLSDAVKLIRGPKGTEVRLTVKRPNGTIKVIPIIREVVNVEDAYAKSAIINLKNSSHKFGYIFLPSFYRDFEAPAGGEEARTSTEDVRKEIAKLKKNGVQGIILDLRSNGGGALEDARLMTGLFVKPGPVVQVKQSNGNIEVLSHQEAKVDYDGDLIVLVNKFSASASEIVAGALQDYKRAIIVGGQHTHGKGTVQVYLNLDQGLAQITSKILPLGAFKVTIQKFYRINGSSTQYKGITSDIVLPDTYDFLETGEEHLPHSLPWDEVSSLKYNTWTVPLPLTKLKKNSGERVAKSEKFKKILENGKLLEKRRKNSLIQLSLNEIRKEQKDLQEDIEKNKLGDESTNLQIVSLVQPKTVMTKNAEENKKLLKEQKEIEDEWVSDLLKDPVLEESANIFEDMLAKP